MQRQASAVWSGGIKDGRGEISTASGMLRDAPYSFTTRFENGAGTNPEELIAAAHAGCFSIRFPPSNIDRLRQLVRGANATIRATLCSSLSSP
jgi:OsmC subfamily peroxiredoxin